MKKIIYLVRHAKSSWDDPSLDDFDRPLNERGKKDAPKMARRMKEREIAPALMVTSPARRAYKTCVEFSKILGIPKSAIRQDPQLYHASEERLLEQVQGLDDKADQVMLFGHNPGLTEFSNLLTGKYIDNIPTTGVVGIRLRCKSWKEAGPEKGQTLFFDFPKKNIRD